MRAQPLVGRLVGLALIIAGLGTVTVATSPEAVAASTRPTAIAVAPNGTSYVGFATGGRLQRVNGAGHRKGSVTLDQDEAVDGLFANRSGDIWVDYETSVSLLGPNGQVRRHWDHDPATTCTDDYSPTRYGGITMANSRVYVANRCSDTLSVYSTGGLLLATVKLPGRPRGVTYGVAQANRPAFVYVAVPDRGQVLAFRADSLRSSSSPASRYKLKRPAGGSRPEPGGVVVDKYGQLTVTDMANNALYLVNTNYKYSLYRTLGHPPRASSQGGRLHMPGALAQYYQDGGQFSGNYFVLDTNNSRIQRWSTGGYTYWAKTVLPGSGGGGGGGGGGGDEDVPVNKSAPSISGSLGPGDILTCSRGSWTNSPTSFRYAWFRDDTAIAGATYQSYEIGETDLGSDLRCKVRAINDAGSSAWASSDTVTPEEGGGGDGPTNLTPPSISGTPAVGNTLTCDVGEWTGSGGPGGSNSYSYQWRRNGAAISGATTATYLVRGTDAGTLLTCQVTAANGDGSTTATSAAVAVAGGDGPTNTSPPSISGDPSPGQVLTCDKGAWSGSGNSYAYAWRRDGSAVAAGTTYTVLSGDVGTSFVCAVTATNDDGSTTAVSAAVTISGPSGHAPSNTAPPVISGTPAVGQTLSCSTGTWTGSPTSYTYLWRRNGSEIPGATGSTYVVADGDAFSSVTCTVVATNGSGSGAATSAAVSIPNPVPPQNITPPSITGTGVVGTALTCDKGAWNDSGATFHFSWRRDGSAIDDTDDNKYVVLSADQGSSLSCSVTARTGAGRATATSSGRGVPAVAPGSPTPTTAPAISGPVGTGSTLTCSTGTWTGSPTSYAIIWQRDGATLASGATYAQVEADAGHALRCVVVATNPSGRGAARSAAVGSTGCGATVGVVINDGDAETTSPAVELTITAPPGATTIAVSNNSSMAGASSFPVSGGCTVPWTMDSIPGLPVTWSVYVQFDNDASTYSDDILIRQPAARVRLW